MSVKDELTIMLKENGASLVGFSNISCVPEERHMGFGYAVTIACALDKDVVKSIQGAPTLIYYDEYNRKNELLNELGARCADYLRQAGYKAEALPATAVGIDENLESAFPHKTGAVLSGLGWIGKCALLITPQYGSAVRLTTVFTDMASEKAQLQKNMCGSCRECVDACPGHAVTGKSWYEGAQRKELFDAFACKKAALEKAAKIGVKNTICGVCIASCPWTIEYTKN